MHPYYRWGRVIYDQPNFLRNIQQDRLVPFDQHKLTKIAEATDEMLAALYPMYNSTKEKPRREFNSMIAGYARHVKSTITNRKTLKPNG